MTKLKDYKDEVIFGKKFLPNLTKGTGRNIGIDINNQLILTEDGGGGSWGSIEGNIEDQTDLINYIANNNAGEPEFLKIENTDGGWGYGTKYRVDNPDSYGDIGSFAIDLSISSSEDDDFGALGDSSIAIGPDAMARDSNSIAIGNYVKAEGYSSIAIGYNAISTSNRSIAIGTEGNEARGIYSVSLGGRDAVAYSFGEISLGLFGTEYTPINNFSIRDDDRLFNIGNGTNISNRSDALTILKDSRTGINISNFETTTDDEHLQVNGGGLFYDTLRYKSDIFETDEPTDRQIPDMGTVKAYITTNSLSSAQRIAINALVSPVNDYADMTEATAAIKAIIDALQAV